jgi:hypothetical protein
MTEETEKQSKGTKWLQMGVVGIALAFVAYMVIRFVISFVWWIFAFMVVALLIVNRKMVMKVFNYLKGLYKKNTGLGVAGTIGGIVAFTPFIVFLLGKTIWDFGRNKVKKEAIDKGTKSGETPILMDDEPLYDDSSFNDYSNNDTFPPTNQ